MSDNMANVTENSALSIKKLIWDCLRYWWVIVCAVIIVGAGFFLYTTFFVTPTFRAGASIYVTNIRSGEDITYLSESNLSAAQRLVNTYTNLLKSDYVLNMAAERLGKDEYTAGRLRSMISTVQEDDTGLFKVYATTKNAEESAKIANVVSRLVPEVIPEMVEGSSAFVVDNAMVPTSKHTPNRTRAVFFGFLIGAVISIAFICVRAVLDTTLKDEEDIAMISDIPIIGRIPEFSENNPHSHYGYGSAKYQTYSSKRESDSKGDEER